MTLSVDGSIQATLLALPKGTRFSRAYALSDDVVVGVAMRAGAAKSPPFLWRGDTPSPLVVEGQKDVSAGGAGGGRVAGTWNSSGRTMVSHPVVWSMDSVVVELDMTGYESAGGRACDAAAVVGWGKLKSGGTHALVWRGRGDVGGHAGGPGRQRAILWKSGACIDLTPKGTAAQVNGVDDGVQVGVVWSSPGPRAARWRSTADSLVDLTPPGHEVARAIGAHRGLACGFVRVKQKAANGFSEANDNRAVLWGDDKDDLVDLHAAIPSPFNASFAHAVHRDGNDVVVVGTCHESSDEGITQERAIVWRFKVKR
jgi:hypothetical protein